MKMSRAEMQASLRTERLKNTQRLMIVNRELRTFQAEKIVIEDRLEAINHAEGIL